MALPQRELFVIGPDQLGFASASFNWSPRGNFLAISGDKVYLPMHHKPQSYRFTRNNWLLTCSAKFTYLTDEASCTTISPCQLQSSRLMRGCPGQERCRYWHTFAQALYSLCNPCAVQWDASGDLLAILPRGNSFAIVWTASTREIAQSEAGFKV